MAKSVYLLYETDAWISTQSLILMGIFTSEENLLNGVKEIVRERFANGDDNFRGEDDDDWDEPIEDVIERVAEEFCVNFQTDGYEVNLYAEKATLDKLGEI